MVSGWFTSVPSGSGRRTSCRRWVHRAARRVGRPSGECRVLGAASASKARTGEPGYLRPPPTLGCVASGSFGRSRLWSRRDRAVRTVRAPDRRLPIASSVVATGSARSSAEAGWRRSIARPMSGSSARSRSRSCDPRSRRDRDLAHRFRREALAATVLRHPNIVACLDTGTDGDQAYLVMALVEGEDLAARLQPQRPARAVAGGAHRPRRRPRPGRRPRPRHRPSRRQARQHPAGRRRPGDGHRLRDRPSGGRRRGGAARDDPRVRPLLQPGTGARHDHDPGLRRLRPRPGPVRGADRARGPGPAQRPTRSPWPASGRRRHRPARSDPRFPPRSRRSFGGRSPRTPATATRTGWRWPPRSRPSSRPGTTASPTSLVPIARLDDGRGGGRPRRPARRRRPVPIPPAVRVGAPSGTSPRCASVAPPAARPRAIGAVERAGRRAWSWSGSSSAALLLGALPGDGATAVPTERSRSRARSPRSCPRRRPSPTPEPTPEPTRRPTPIPTEEPTALPAGDVADLCEIFFDIPCGLGAGRYAPSRFSPAFDIELGDGWSNATHSGRHRRADAGAGRDDVRGRDRRGLPRTARRRNRGTAPAT